MKGRIRTCYISATPGANLDVLGEVLRDRGIATARASSVLAGASLDHEVLEALQNVDVVIGVISSERRSQWVLYELGQARALGKQILLFAPPKSALTAPDLSRFLIVRAGIRNREAVAFAVDQLLAAPERLVQRQQSSGSARAGLGARVNDLLVELRSILSTRDALGLEKLVTRSTFGSSVRSTDVSSLNMVELSAAIAPRPTRIRFKRDGFTYSVTSRHISRDSMSNAHSRVRLGVIAS